MREDPNATYDLLRCRTCGFPWMDHSTKPQCNHQRPKPAPDPIPSPNPLPSLIPSPNFDSLRERRRAWEEKGELERKLRAARIRSEIEETVSPGNKVERSGYIRVVDGEDAARLAWVALLEAELGATEPRIVLRVGSVELPPMFYGYPESTRGVAP